MAFDEQEHGTAIASNAVAFPYATQVVPSAPLSAAIFGFMQMNLGTAVASGNVPLQSFVSVRQLSPGKFGDGTPADLLITQSQLVCQATMGCVQTFPESSGPDGGALTLSAMNGDYP